ncbi:MAG: ArsR/SmtB family transcription factor [Candidatus Saccharibacteria bacterium]
MDPHRIAKALSDPIRWEILRLINRMEITCEKASPRGPGENGLCVNELVEHLGLIQSKVSYHIRELKTAELVREEARGRWIIYTVREETLKEYLEWMSSEFEL